MKSNEPQTRHTLGAYRQRCFAQLESLKASSSNYQTALAACRTEEADGILADLQLEAEELAGVPTTAAMELPIWDLSISEDEIQLPVAPCHQQAREHAALFESEGARVRWHVNGPNDKLTCDECRELLSQGFAASELPDMPVHPGCRCMLVVAMD